MILIVEDDEGVIALLKKAREVEGCGDCTDRLLGVSPSCNCWNVPIKGA